MKDDKMENSINELKKNIDAEENILISQNQFNPILALDLLQNNKAKFDKQVLTGTPVIIYFDKQITLL